MVPQGQVIKGTEVMSPHFYMKKGYYAVSSLPETIRDEEHVLSYRKPPQEATGGDTKGCG